MLRKQQSSLLPRICSLATRQLQQSCANHSSAYDDTKRTLDIVPQKLCIYKWILCTSCPFLTDDSLATDPSHPLAANQMWSYWFPWLQSRQRQARLSHHDLGCICEENRWARLGLFAQHLKDPSLRIREKKIKQRKTKGKKRLLFSRELKNKGRYGICTHAMIHLT